MPGPLLVVALARTPSRGPMTGPLVTVGHGIVEIVTVILLALGLAVVVGERPEIARIIAVVGGVALAVMAALMFYEVKKGIKVPGQTPQSVTAPVSSLRLIREGMVATISNPYWFVWWGTIGSVLVISSLKAGAAGPPVFYVGHILSDLVWYTLVTTVVWQGKSFLSGKRYHVVIGICALFLLWLSGVFIYDGLTGAITLT